MKIKALMLMILVTLLTLTSCKVDYENKVHKQDVPKYRIVEPTQEELGEITNRLDYILSMFHKDYDCKNDNIYEYLFVHNNLDYVYPQYDEEVSEYISPPLRYRESGSMSWYIYEIPQNDPLGKFIKIREEFYDENGNIDLDKAYELSTIDGIFVDEEQPTIGHNMFSGAYIDWLVEGVWNGKVDHETFFEFKDGTLLYYHDGNYYTPELLDDRGGGIMNTPHIQKITPLDGNKYEIEYYITDDVDPNHYCKAVIGLKENTDGFRFWSIFSIDYDTNAE